MNTAAIYCRVSTQGQADDGTSLDTQQQMCEKFCREKGYTSVLTIKEARSGASLRRPGLDEVRDLARDGAIQAVIAYAPDRLSRDQADLLLVAKELKLHKIDLLFVTLPKDNSIFGDAIFQMAGIFAEVERRTIQERTMRGKAQRVKEGKVLLSCAAPYGYRYIEGEGRIEIIAHEAEWVYRMYEWVVLEQASLGDVVRRLHTAGVPTQRGSDHWQRSTVQRILANHVNSGTWYYNKREAVLARKPKNPDNAEKKWSKEWRPRSEWVGASVPAIVSEELFEAAQRQLTRNREQSPRSVKHNYLLKGLLICEHCGYKMFAHAKDGGRRRFYRCTGRAKHQAHLPLEERCHVGSYSATKLEERVWQRVLEIVNKPELIYKALENHEQATNTQRRRDDETLATLEGMRQNLKREVGKLLDLHMEDVIDRATLQERMAVTKKKQQGIEKKLEEAVGRAQQHQRVEGDIATVRAFCQKVEAGLPYITAEDRRAFLEALHSEIRMVTEEEFTFNGLINNITLLFADEKQAQECASGTGTLVNAPSSCSKWPPSIRRPYE